MYRRFFHDACFSKFLCVPPRDTCIATPQTYLQREENNLKIAVGKKNTVALHGIVNLRKPAHSGKRIDYAVHNVEWRLMSCQFNSNEWPLAIHLLKTAEYLFSGACPTRNFNQFTYRTDKGQQWKTVKYQLHGTPHIFSSSTSGKSTSESEWQPAQSGTKHTEQNQYTKP